MKAFLLIILQVAVINSELVAAPAETEKPQPVAKPYLRFMAYFGDPSRPEDIRFQLSTPVSRLRRESTFLKMGEIVLGTKFKLMKFEFKSRTNPQGKETDVSEITLEHVDTKEEIVLVLGEK